MSERQTYGQRALKVLARFGMDTFILLLLAMIVLAWLFPQGGLGEGPWSLSRLSGYGVSFIFFFYGLKLNFGDLRAGLRNWRLHLVVHASSFILFPLLILSCKGLFTGETYPLWLGTFFLASLPSTVSSSVVMVSIAEGNIPAAIFNASISSIIGVFITPLWMSLVDVGSGDSMDTSDMITKLALQVLLPVFLGILLNRKWGQWAVRFKKQLKYFDQAVILSIVYTSFCESFAENLFSNIGMLELVLLGISLVLLFFIAYGLIMLVSKALSFNREDKITAVFCGSKKSLVHGTVMSKVLFANSTITGILLLPLMLYHALQLVIVSMIAQRMARGRK
ncbi:bile acid:sodium symporter family protein [Aridibaculum aurantiacum]|uniref:bile acid:sodium symporter family protein n=1 Tax=Aridibaculum aurantiacum TaxID=2810307 RepID=UPI001A969441|nr:bile acid:sodium symporter family protein [Aridibaculum aurantiacum]